MRHRDSRLAAHGTVATHLALLSDRRLADVVAAAPLRSSIGGRSAEMDINGTRVFVKRVPLTEIELSSANIRSTSNLFGLPMFYQYGLGSAGFGAWRELAVHAMTTNWVIANEYQGFPLMYHWRILGDSPPQGFADEFGGIDGAVAHWDGSPAVRRRLEAIGRSSASLVLFLEHVPQTLATWLDGHRAAAPTRTDGRSYSWLEGELVRGATFMSSRGLVHFDAHSSNILTDGGMLYFSDFGLALSSGFELSPPEVDFLSRHVAYDRCYVASQLLRHIPGGMRSPEITAIVDRHTPPAGLLNEFHRRLRRESKSIPFPVAEIDQALRVGPRLR